MMQKSKVLHQSIAALQFVKQGLFSWCVIALCGPAALCNHAAMPKLAIIAAALALAVIVPSAAQGAGPAYNFQDRTRALAFDPSRFFPERSEPAMSIRYLGDDYGYPVYAIAVRKGCTQADQGEARRTCGGRLTARMIRSPYKGKLPRPRARGQRLFGMIAQANPQTDEALLRLLDNTGLEWLEADIRKCPAAMTHLATGRDLKFSSPIDQSGSWDDIVLHADTISFGMGDYLTRSRYEGWLKSGSPAAWANEFADSLETCWKPSTATVPWRIIRQ